MLPISCVGDMRDVECDIIATEAIAASTFGSPSVGDLEGLPNLGSVVGLAASAAAVAAAASPIVPV